MASTPGAYNYVVTVRADLPPRPRFFVFLSLFIPGARALLGTRQRSDPFPPPHRAGAKAHERDAQRGRQLHPR